MNTKLAIGGAVIVAAIIIATQTSRGRAQTKRIAAKLPGGKPCTCGDVIAPQTTTAPATGGRVDGKDELDLGALASAGAGGAWRGAAARGCGCP